MVIVKKSLLLFLFLLFFLFSPAHAFLNTTGSTGLLFIPDTDLQPPGSFTINYYNVGFISSRININYGINSFLELGLHLSTQKQHQKIGPSIKGILPIDETDDVEVAVGLSGTDLYAVLGSSLGTEGFNGFVGFGSGELKGFFGGFYRNLEPLILLGGDYVLPSRLVVEYVDHGLNLGLQLMWSDEVGMSVGVKDILGDNNLLLFGLQFSTHF